METTMKTKTTRMSKVAAAIMLAVLSLTGSAVAMSADGEAVVVQIIASAGATDSDRDGLSDAVEANLGTNPSLADTDGDSLVDSWEVWNGLDPLNVADGTMDSDSDGLTNAEEQAAGTSPKLADTDGDGFWDAFELAHGTDPVSGEGRPVPGRRGDVNCDGSVNVKDVQTLVNTVLGMNAMVPTDQDANGRTDARDVQYIVNVLLGF